MYELHKTNNNRMLKYEDKNHLELVVTAFRYMGNYLLN
jgi:hypothetical protein